MTDKINIQNVAKLAAIKLTNEEEQKLEKDLSMIIDHFVRDFMAIICCKL